VRRLGWSELGHALAFGALLVVAFRSKKFLIKATALKGTAFRPSPNIEQPPGFSR
jgi:hypothetical protein